MVRLGWRAGTEEDGKGGVPCRGQGRGDGGALMVGGIGRGEEK